MERTLTYTTDHFIRGTLLGKNPTGGAAAGYHLRGRGSHGDQ